MCEKRKNGSGSDKRFENTTLLLGYLPHTIQFTKEKITLKKPWFWVEKRTRYLIVNRAAKNKLVLKKIGA